MGFFMAKSQHAIKVVALDIYGTLLATSDPDNELKSRKGAEKFFKKCSSRGIKVVSASDAHIPFLKSELEECLERVGLGLEVFDSFYQLNQLPCKDFSQIIADYRISPCELLVIGDRLDKDIEGARRCGACYIHVPEFVDHVDYFDLSRINF